jgi:hypothetical protein
LPLFHLSAHNWGAVCRVVQRQAVRVSIGVRHSIALRSSVNAIRSFCGHCGTQLTFQSDDCSDAIDITTCSLDHPEAVSPRDHTHMSRKLPWIHLSDGLAQYSQARPSG